MNLDYVHLITDNDLPEEMDRDRQHALMRLINKDPDYSGKNRPSFQGISVLSVGEINLVWRLDRDGERR